MVTASFPENLSQAHSSVATSGRSLESNDTIKLLLAKQLRGDEGSSRYAYQDSEGWWTIGIGRLCDRRKPGSGLTDFEQNFLFNNDCEKVLRQVDVMMPWLNEHDMVRKGAIMNMVFQMGPEGVLGFRNSLIYFRAKEYDRAADNFARSEWARQTPNRARRVIKQIRTGQWQFVEDERREG